MVKLLTKASKSKTYKCIECEQTFQTFYHLKEHMLLHTEIKHCRCCIFGRFINQLQKSLKELPLHKDDASLENGGDETSKQSRLISCGNQSTTDGGEDSNKVISPVTNPTVNDLEVKDNADESTEALSDERRREMPVCLEKKEGKRKFSSPRKNSLRSSCKSEASEKSRNEDENFALNSRLECDEKKRERADCATKPTVKCLTRRRLSDKSGESKASRKNVGKKIHRCKSCHEIFSSKRQLEMHEDDHSKDDASDYSDGCVDAGDDDYISGEDDVACNVKCENCNKEFYNKRLLQNHMSLHSGEKPFECQVCGYVFRLKVILKRHMMSHSDEASKSCNICDSTFKDVGQLKLHMVSHVSDKPVKCGECGKSFDKKARLERHMLTHMPWNKSHQCNVCNKRFVDAYVLKNHVELHGEKIYKCNDCGSSFATSRYLRNHMLRHQSLRAFQCKECGKAFKQKSTMIRHAKIHTGEKPCICEVCGKGFRTIDHLHLHMTTHTGERNCPCTICGKMLRRKSDVTQHMKIHTGERGHQCEICGKDFRQAAHLKRHMMIHSGEKPFKCETCGKDFRRLEHLKSHASIHSSNTGLSVMAPKPKKPTVNGGVADKQSVSSEILYNSAATPHVITHISGHPMMFAQNQAGTPQGILNAPHSHNPGAGVPHGQHNGSQWPQYYENLVNEYFKL